MEVKISIRPSKKGDTSITNTFRGITAEQNGEVVGVAGVMHGHELQAFSSIGFDASTHKRLIVSAIRQYRDILNSYDVPVYAKANDKIAGSEQFLRHVGFVDIGDRIYKWIPQQQV